MRWSSVRCAYAQVVPRHAVPAVSQTIPPLVSGLCSAGGHADRPTPSTSQSFSHPRASCSSAGWKTTSGCAGRTCAPSRTSTPCRGKHQRHTSMAWGGPTAAAAPTAELARGRRRRWRGAAAARGPGAAYSRLPMPCHVRAASMLACSHASNASAARFWPFPRS